MVGARKQQAEKRGAERDTRGHLADDLRLAEPAERRGHQAREANDHCDLEKKKRVIKHRIVRAAFFGSARACRARLRGRARAC